MPSRVTVITSNAHFKVSIVANASLLRAGSTFSTYWVNLSEVSGVNFTGDYANFTTKLRPGYALLVWTYSIESPSASLYYSIIQQQAMPTETSGVNALGLLLFLILPILLGVVLIIGGIILYRRSNK